MSDSPPKNRLLLTLIYEIKLKFNQVILWFSIKLGFIREIIIVPFNGFGNSSEIYLVGRVLKNNRVTKSNPEDSVWSNVKKMIRRFRTVIIPGAKVQASIDGENYVVETNEEGYFELTIKGDFQLQKEQSWLSVRFTLLDQILKNQGVVSAEAKVFIPSKNASVGVISDIDDTIIPTGATRLLEMLKTTFAKNAYSRVPFPGISELYSDLRRGASWQDNNPFFYVSSSPWNLFDFLMELLDIHRIPFGPLMLRDIGLSRSELISGSHRAHKMQQIRHIIRVSDPLPFLLIGDSGQEDPEIYLQIVREFPSRILMVFIRDVDDSRLDYVSTITQEMAKLGVDLRFGKDVQKAREVLIRHRLLPDLIEQKRDQFCSSERI
ncbi:App1 family protein [Algoriphagus namhaensis]|uniref:App1 family protein n=1 Tax=Algoriphagus namhaensis TaxID=915353 RepID=A0ABV8APD9_9BACT